MLYDGVSSVDKEIKIYDGFYHEVFNEPEHDKVLHDVEIWLEAHLGSRKQTDPLTLPLSPLGRGGG
jgi:alpha-beta hydrolase superfamily lysophospholipase